MRGRPLPPGLRQLGVKRRRAARGRATCLTPGPVRSASRTKIYMKEGMALPIGEWQLARDVR